ARRSSGREGERPAPTETAVIRADLAGLPRPGYFARMNRRLLAGLTLVCLASCSQIRPDLVEVYPNAARIEHRPVIIVPGVFGSRLKNSITGEVVWGRFANLLTSRFKLALNSALSQRADLLDLPID